MRPILNTVIVYTRKTDEMIRFYCDHFGYEAIRRPDDRIIELRSETGGMSILLHPASKGRKEGQSLVKLMFTVEDVAAARAALIASGVDVGPLHQADGYVFANMRDPSKNSVSISGRAFAPTRTDRRRDPEC